MMSSNAAKQISKKILLKAVMWSLPQRTVLRHGVSAQAGIALTFDDGPHPEGTPRVLDVLRSCQVRATFFLVGKRAAAYPDLVRQIVSDGHEVGNHTHSHQILSDLNREEWIQETKAGFRTLESLTGQPVSLFRPPHGELSLSILHYLTQQRKTTVFWSVDPKDFATDQHEALWKKLATKQFRGGDIILLHDWVPATAVVLPKLIKYIYHAGLRFTTVGEMLQ